MWALIHSDWCSSKRGQHPVKKKTHGEDIHETTKTVWGDAATKQGTPRIAENHKPGRGEEALSPRAEREWTALPAHVFQPCSLQSRERIRSVVRSLPMFGTLSRQP